MLPPAQSWPTAVGNALVDEQLSVAPGHPPLAGGLP
jgi:hypothetical protein